MELLKWMQKTICIQIESFGLIPEDFFMCARHGRSLTGESPECGLIVPST